MKVFKVFILLFGQVIDTATMGVFAYTFYLAATNGGQVTIYINQRGEQLIETILIPIFLIFAIVADIFAIKDLVSSTNRSLVRNLVRKVFSA